MDNHRRNYNWYNEHAQHVNLANITSSDKNADILHKLRDGDHDFTVLSIVRTDYGDADDFVVREDDDMEWVGYFIGSSKQLEKLTIYHWPEERVEQIDALLWGISHNQSILKLCIYSELGFDASQNLAPFFRNNSNLTTLSIKQRHNIADGSAVAFVLGQCRHRSLKKLEIEGIDDVQGMVQIATALRTHSQIEDLELVSNMIGRSGYMALGNTLQSWGPSNLRSLYLFSNDIDDECLHSLVGGLANCHSLTRLGLMENELITAIGLRSLATVFQSGRCSLEVLDLRGINIGDEGAIALADGLVGNTSLRNLFLCLGSGVTNVGWAAFSKLLCDTSSINNTYLSNHTLQTIRWAPWGEESLPGITPDVSKFLMLNQEHEKPAIDKILTSHSDFDMESFFQWKLKLLPVVVAWFTKAWPYRFLWEDERLWGDDDSMCALRQSTPRFQSRCLSAIYKFVRGMPKFVLDSYRGQNILTRRSKKRGLDGETK
jgi:Leucine-rich repeat (LRR) protein